MLVNTSSTHKDSSALPDSSSGSAADSSTRPQRSSKGAAESAGDAAESIKLLGGSSIAHAAGKRGLQAKNSPPRRTAVISCPPLHCPLHQNKLEQIGRGWQRDGNLTRPITAALFFALVSPARCIRCFLRENGTMKIRVKDIEIGDFVEMGLEVKPTSELTAQQKMAGRPVALLFLRDSGEKSVVQLRAFADLYEEFLKLNATVLGVAVARVEALRTFAEQHQLPFPLLADTQLQMSLAYGSARPERAEGEKAEVSIGRRTVLLDANYRVARIYDSIDPERHAMEVLEDVRRLVSLEPPRAILQQAPVLLIPNVLPPEFCKELMQIWETQGNQDSGFMKQVGDKTVGMLDYGHKIRRDHFIKDEAMLARVKKYIVGRVVPEMKKAFNYDVTRFEDFRIACYDASKGGYFRPHRDNTTEGTAHRRFAMSLLLTDDYEGGNLRFPEYGPHTYKPGAGSAVIFSCSLLHEATDVTAGRRFVLLSFFYGERERMMRDEYERRAAAQKSQMG
jgi:peroxiredoxin/predicted 2-oxoglutarate/Fe(II)-dependent dioxygenase YbiX